MMFDDNVYSELFSSEPNFEHSLTFYISYLEEATNNFNFQDDFSSCLLIFPIISELLYTKELKKRDKIKIYERLKSIREKLQILILQKPGDISKSNHNFSLLKKLVDQTESLMIASFYDMLPQYDGNSLQLIEYLLFEVKQYQLISDILEQYPYMIRLIDRDNTKLITKVIDNYIKESFIYTSGKELKPDSDLVYYDKVLSLFLNHEKLEFSFQERKDIVGKVRNYRKNIDNNFYNEITKQKLVFWLNRLEEKLEGINHLDEFNEICYMHDIKTYFDEGILSEARRIGTEIKPSTYPNYHILDNEYIITIDGDNAEELDDGISIKKLENGYYKLGVHIANPMGIIKSNNIIFEEALKRTSSIYIGHEPIYLFPKLLSKDKMNLLEGKYRLSTSYYLYIDDNGSIDNYEFIESIISVHNTTYKVIDDILNTGTCKDDKLFDTVTLLSEVTSKISKTFHIDETYELLNRTIENPSKTNIVSKTKSSKMVEICMMMANYIVPYHMHKNNLPCIYRIHVIDQDFIKKLSSISSKIHSTNKKEANDAIHYLQSIYPKAKYSTEAKGHFGLGLPVYSHVTSPLRRIADDVMKEYVLDPFYFNHVSDVNKYKIEAKLSEICTYINKRSLIIDSFMNYQKEAAKILTKH